MSKSTIKDLAEKPSKEPTKTTEDELTDEELKPVCGGGISATPPSGSKLKMNQ